MITGKNITHRGNIYASGRSGGKVKILSKENIDINGNILAKGIGDIGGDIVFMSEKT